MDIKDRFLDKVPDRPHGGCWLWRGCVTRNGYGQFMMGTRKAGTKGARYAHRVAYQLFIGEIPDGMDIDHKCHNRSCVNPDHLRACTRSENIRNSLTHNDSHSGIKGISRTRSGKWRARLWTGTLLVQSPPYNTPEEAHRAYCEMAKIEFGDFFCNGRTTDEFKA